MTLEEKAIEFIRETKCKPKDRPDKQIKLFYEEELKLLIGFATEVAKELEQTNNKLLDVINNQDVKIADLESENAELKDALKGKRCNCMTYLNFKDLEKELTKAKEHINTLISCLIDWVQEGDKDYCHIADAEQFLKEIEK